MGELQFGTRDERRIGSEPDVIRADPLCQELTPLCLFLNSNRMGGCQYQRARAEFRQKIGTL
jgi:hypothetical protein